MFNRYDTRDIVDYPFSRKNWGEREEAIGRNDFPGLSFLPSFFFSFENDREKFLMACVWASCNLLRQCNNFPAETYLPAQYGVFSYIFLSIISHPLRFMYML